MSNQREKLFSKFNIYYAVITVNFASVSAGCVLTWSSPIITKLTKTGERILITEDQGAWLSSLVAVGASLGPFVAGCTIDKIGRKWTIIADMILFLASWFILAYFTLIYWMYFARILAGIATGIIFTVVPMYVAETVPIDLRETLGSLLQIFLYIGSLMSYAIGPFISYVNFNVISAVIPLICIITFIRSPESPFFLLYKNRKQEAFEALEWLRNCHEKILIQTEITDILASIKGTRQNSGSIKVLFSEKFNCKSLYYSCALVFFLQSSGINVVLFYGETIFKATGSVLPPNIPPIIIGIVMTLAAGAVTPIVKIFGMKNLLCFSAIGEIVGLGVLGFYFFLEDNHKDVSEINWLPITSLIIFVIAYCMGFGAFVWVIIAELFPGDLRAIASAITTSFCWFLCFIYTRFFSILADNLGQSMVFWMFGVFCFFALIFVIFQLPDIEGKSFQKIQELIKGGKK